MRVGRNGEVVEIAERVWSAPELDSLRKIALLPESLVVIPQAIRLRVGDSFDVVALAIVAFDSTGRAIEGAPVRIDLEQGILASRGRILEALRVGETELVVSALLPRPGGVLQPATRRVTVATFR
jgi:hypothetical protein